MTYDYQGEKSILLLLAKEWDKLRDGYMQFPRDEEGGSKAAEYSRIAAAYKHCADGLRKVLGAPPKRDGLPNEDDQGGAIDRLRERFAAQAHEAWSGWMRHLFKKSNRNDDGSITIPAAYVENLQRLIDMSYADLSEEEKESDRKEADEYLAIYSAYLEEVLGSLPDEIREVLDCYESRL